MSQTNKNLDKRERPQKFQVAESHILSKRSKWLRDYFYKGREREWNNQFMPFTTGTEWDINWHEGDWYINPEVYFFIQVLGKKDKGVFASSYRSMAVPIKLPSNFWDLSIPERRILFLEEVMLNYIPQEIISENDLIAGGRFNTQLSKCFNKKEFKKYWKWNIRNREANFKFHYSGFGNVGAAPGHLIPDYKTVIQKGFKYIHDKTKNRYERLTEREKKELKGKELRGILMATEIPKKLAQKYVEECRRLKAESPSSERSQELEWMAQNLEKVPWKPAETFWEALQSLWLTHLLLMAEESYPGAGLSFGRMDQYLWPYYKKDVIDDKLITKDFAKELLSSFWFHCNTAYDAMIRLGKQGITSAYGQLLTLSGCGPNGEDLTNELTYTILEVIDEWYPSLEPKPNVKLHRNTPDKFLNTIIDMISRAQGAPFLINFDERSMAGLTAEGVPREDVWNYACVGCLENTMQGNDRSGTVNCNPNLVKSIELTLWNGKNMPGNIRATKEGEQIGPKTGIPEKFEIWEEFWNAWKKQIEFLIKYMVDVYNQDENIAAKLMPTPLLSSIVRGCIEKGLDIRQGGPEYRYVTVNGVGFATLVDSLLAIKKLIYDEKRYTISQLKDAIMNNFEGSEYEKMRIFLKNKVPKFGNDIDEADNFAKKIMKIWADECWKYKTLNNFQYRPGMLSWNYWAGEDASLTIATPNGRKKGTFLSNAICPTSGADIEGPTSVTNSVGKALGGKTEKGEFINYLPNGSSQTITFNPSILRDPENKEKFKSYLKSYVENGGTCLQVNMLDAEMLKDAQSNPDNYKNLLVRVTGYNAYFTAIGKELQDEIIARECHKM
ncbi:MAG: pyruvate formate lyase family protein [Promethearchaeota archaeon]